MGSAVDVVVAEYSDIDLALYLNCKQSLNLFQKVYLSFAVHT
jgi:hypothetical protein